MKITKETATELKTAIQEKMSELEEYGVYIDVKGVYFNENSFFLNIQGQTEKNQPFDLKAKRELLF